MGDDRATGDDPRSDPGSDGDPTPGSDGDPTPGSDGDPTPGSDGEHRVTLAWRDGRETSLAVPEGEVLLDAAEDAGIGLPYGCRTGACATCTARLVSGDLEHRRPPRALKDRHLDEGYVLTCIAVPRSDCRLEVGSEVAGDLVENPWK